MATDNPTSHAVSNPNIIAKATRTRRIFAFLSSFLFLVALIFLILVEIGNLNARHPVLPSIYFIKLDLSNIIPRSVPNSRLINSIARTLGLHDFYQVGLWNFCEGYGNQVTDCSRPTKLYWFNPVDIILNELLAGATIALPSDITDALTLVRIASHWMFALFLAGICLTLPSALLAPLSISTRWASLPLTILTFLTALSITAASIIASAMFLIFRSVIQKAADSVNIQAEIGTKMFAFMWIASGAAVLGWFIQFAGCCCCASTRDVKTGRRRGRRKAYPAFGRGSGVGETATEEKPRARRRWLRSGA
ncbi:MAG: hypothetical protein L6R40_008519 [Gallowayella cf. fulva]|nr:MAG: hypothetical protein L6R40_008519 [Xanthomendoza cf. fulva]